jgi:flagellar motor switch protein FliM
MDMREKWLGRIRDRIMDVPVEVTAILGRKRMSLHEFAAFGSGNVIMVDRYVNDSIDIEIHKRTKFRGKMGIFKGSKAVKVEDLVQ